MLLIHILASAVILVLSGVSGFNHLGLTNRPHTSNSFLCGKLSRSNGIDAKTSATDEALTLLNEASALRAQASALQQQLDCEKEERIRKQRDKVDSLIDALLFHGMNVSPRGPAEDKGLQKKNKQQLLHTEEQVATLLVSKRMSYDMVNQMFDRLVELSNRPQSIDSCSPLLSLLLDAACKVDCMEREDNPNKRWNHRVERDLRRKLFALGYGIRIEDVDEKNRVRSITGEKDYL